MPYLYTVKTLEALDASIAHWRKVIKCEHPDHANLGNNNCALCLIFWRRGCQGCPIRDATARPYCQGTPYGDASEAKQDWTTAIICEASKRTITKRKRAFRSHARKMLAVGVDLRANLKKDHIG